MSPPWEKQSNVWAQVAYYTGLGFILPGGLLAGYAIGWGLDRWLRTSPVLAVVMAALGVAGAFVEVLRILMRAEKACPERSEGDGSGDTSNRGPGAS